MNGKTQLVPKILQYKLFRSLGIPRVLPINLTVSVTYHCNSRCKTCNVWRRKVEEFTLEEFDKTFRNLGQVPFWFTMSGGEPFTRKDLVEICQSAYSNCRPGIINIPTNGILSERIPSRVSEIAESCPNSQVVINLSVDGIGEKHDEIRCVEGNFDKALETYRSLQALQGQYPNLDIGIHTVISRFNVAEICNIYNYFKNLNGQSNGKSLSYITEIAEERVELDTVGKGISPQYEDYVKAINFLEGELKAESFSGMSKITQAFRLEYYELVKKVLAEKRQIIPCYAGFASAHIAPDGDVWQCCIKAEPLGNLRDVDYDLRKIWYSEKADLARKSAKRGECFCPMANASYTNMLCDSKTSIRVGMKQLL